MFFRKTHNSDTNQVSAPVERAARCAVESLEGRTFFAANPFSESAFLSKAAKLKIDVAAVANLNGGFSSFSVTDASYDSTLQTAFQNGALRAKFDGLFKATSKVTIEALQNGASVATLGTYNIGGSSNALINLAFSTLTPGTYEFRASGIGTLGLGVTATAPAVTILPVTTDHGTFGGETLNYNGGLGTGKVIFGLGGTDTLDFGSITKSQVKNLDGQNINAPVFAIDLVRSASSATPAVDLTSIRSDLVSSRIIDSRIEDLAINFNAFSPTGSTNNQAIYRGSSFDHMTLADGREIYFQGIETLKFADGIVDMTLDVNDPSFADQWNIHVTDVDGAWRFTRGSSNVLLASLDTGILTAAGASGGIHDIDTGRLITDSTDDDNFNNYGHGHSAISVMSSTANNGSKVAGINRVSDVYVTDVYSGVNLQTAITDAINYAKSQGKKIVFQGGIQGESWLTSGGTKTALENLIKNNKDMAFFAIAAGNGGPGGNLTDPNYLTSVSGVAKLQSNHGNVASIGALKKTTQATIDGLVNAASVDLASYSNRGSNLTLVAPTDSPAANKNNVVGTFGGTSCANPNLAAMASLVWSVNPSLTGSEVRNILTRTAMDLGTAGKDNTFGAGLVNTEAAVRRAWSLNKDSALTKLGEFTFTLPIKQYVIDQALIRPVIDLDAIQLTELPRFELPTIGKAKKGLKGLKAAKLKAPSMDEGVMEVATTAPVSMGLQQASTAWSTPASKSAFSSTAISTGDASMDEELLSLVA